MPIIIVILTALGWVLAEIAFESGWQMLKAKSVVGLSKGTACRIWWLFLSVCALVGGVGQFLVSFLFIASLGISHCALAQTNDGIITLSDVLRNVPASTRAFVENLKHYIR